MKAGTLTIVLALFCGMSSKILVDAFKPFDQFNIYLRFFERDLRADEKIRIAQAVWGQIRADFPKDTEKISHLYEIFLEFYNTDNNRSLREQMVSATLLQDIRRYLVEQIAEEIASMWMSNNSSGLFLANTLVLQKYEKSLVLDIFDNAIDIAYSVGGPEKISNSLREIYIENDLLTFETMLQTQMNLFSKFDSRGDVDDKYLFNVAYFIRKAKQEKLYKSVPETVTRRVERFIQAIPSTLRYFFFEQRFRLLNKESPGYLYNTIDININDKKRYVFHWDDPKLQEKEPYGYWLLNSTEKINPHTSHLDVRFALKDEKYNMFLYLDQSAPELMNMVAAWRDGNAPTSSAWEVQLINDALVFSQNGFIMCASKNFYNNQRRYTNGFNDLTKYSPNTKACQWIAE